jgi:hypothetical protein
MHRKKRKANVCETIPARVTKNGASTSHLGISSLQAHSMTTTEQQRRRSDQTQKAQMTRLASIWQPDQSRLEMMS